MRIQVKIEEEKRCDFRFSWFISQGRKRLFFDSFRGCKMHMFIDAIYCLFCDSMMSPFDFDLDTVKREQVHLALLMNFRPAGPIAYFVWAPAGGVSGYLILS